jgi:EmrB/QacA subfamily drug resistance transporter
MTERTASAPARNRWTLLAVISIGTLSSTLDGGIVSVAYPALARAFSAGTSTVLWVTVAYWVTAVGLLLTLGWVGDVVGRRRVFATGLAVFAAGVLLAGLSTTVWQLIAFRVLQGVGSAMVLSNLNALITTNFPARDRGKALGVSGAIVGVGLTAGPLLGGFLLEVLDWRAVFYSRAPISAAGAVLTWWLLPADRVARGQFRVDVIGAAALFGALASILLVVNQGGRLGFTSRPVLVLAIVAAVCLPVLAWSERRSVRPILEVGLLRSRQYTLSLLVLVSHYLAQGGIILVAPFFLLDSLGFSAAKMGLFIAAFSMGRTFLAPLAGRLSDTFGPRPFLLLGNTLLAIALFWLSRQGTGASDWALFSGLLLASAGSSFFEPVVTSSIMGSVPQDRAGTASASVALGRQTAFAVGVTVAGAIFTIRQRVYEVGAEAAGLDSGSAKAEAIGRAFGDTVLAGVVIAAIAVAFSLATRGRPAVSDP